MESRIIHVYATYQENNNLIREFQSSSQEFISITDLTICRSINLAVKTESISGVPEGMLKESPHVRRLKRSTEYSPRPLKEISTSHPTFQSQQIIKLATAAIRYLPLINKLTLSNLSLSELELVAISEQLASLEQPHSLRCIDLHDNLINDAGVIKLLQYMLQFPHMTIQFLLEKNCIINSQLVEAVNLATQHNIAFQQLDNTQERLERKNEFADELAKKFGILVHGKGKFVHSPPPLKFLAFTAWQANKHQHNIGEASHILNHYSIKKI